MADVNAVDNIIEHIDQLGHHSGNRQAEQQFAYRGRSQFPFILLHSQFPSFLSQ
jgi:hypothetical protein